MTVGCATKLIVFSVRQLVDGPRSLHMAVANFLEYESMLRKHDCMRLEHLRTVKLESPEPVDFGCSWIWFQTLIPRAVSQGSDVLDVRFVLELNPGSIGGDCPNALKIGHGADDRRRSRAASTF